MQKTKSEKSVDQTQLETILGIFEEGQDGPKHHWVDSRAFNVSIGFAVFLNSLQIGVELDVDLGVAGEVLENVFCALWLLEMIAKLSVHGRMYFKHRWNLLDFTLAWMTIVDVWILQTMDTDTFRSSGLKRMFLLRILRLVRLVRLVKALRAFEELWLLVNGLVQAFSLLIWVFILFSLILYVGAVCVTTVIGKNCMYADENFSECDELFGTLLASMMTSFQIITMDGWTDVLRPVASFSPIMICFFVLLMLLTTFGLLNIVTGVIVEQTMRHSQENEEKLAKLREIQQGKDLAVLKEIFEAADKDGGGTVSLVEFIRICERQDVQDMFQDLNLPVSRVRLATRLFEVLDGNMQGAIEIKEFLTSTLRLKHEGRQLQRDPTLLLMETRHLARRLTRIEKHMGTIPCPTSPRNSITREAPEMLKKSPTSPQPGGLVLQVNDGGKVQVNQALGSHVALQDEDVSNSALLKELRSLMQSQIGAVQSEVGSLKREMQGMRTQISNVEAKLENIDSQSPTAYVHKLRPKNTSLTL